MLRAGAFALGLLAPVALCAISLPVYAAGDKATAQMIGVDGQEMGTAELMGQVALAVKPQAAQPGG